MPVVDPTPALLYAAHRDLYLTENHSFPFQQTHPALSVINRKDLFVPVCECVWRLCSLSMHSQMSQKLGERSYGSLEFMLNEYMQITNKINTWEAVFNGKMVLVHFSNKICKAIFDQGWGCPKWPPEDVYIIWVVYTSYGIEVII